jgi:cell division protein ZapA
MPLNNKVKLTICSAEYIVSTEESEEYVLGLAKQLEKDMNNVLEKSTRASTTTAAVLSALTYLDELKKSKSSDENLRKQLREYLDDCAKYRLEAENSKREIEYLKKEIALLKGKL